MGRLLRGTFKLTLIVGIVGGLVVAAKKLMGGLGPQPGDPAAPKEWPSLVPDPAAGNGNGSSNGSGAAATGAASPTTTPIPSSSATTTSPENGDALAAAVGGLTDEALDAGTTTATTDDVKLEPTDAEAIPTTAPEASES